jgi:hypothetical protein
MTFTFLLSSGTLATIVPSLDLHALCERADLIVVGRAVDVREGGPTNIVNHGRSSPGRRMVVLLDTELVVKGTVDATSLSFTFSLPATPTVSSLHTPVSTGQFGVFFLSRAGGGYEVADSYYPSVVAAPGSPRTSGNCLDQVTAEVAHALASSKATLAVKKSAVHVLQGIDTPIASAALRAAARNQPVLVRIWAIAALLARNDISVLESAEQLMASEDPNVAQKAKAAVAYGLTAGVKDPRAVPVLTRLLRSGDASIRRGAASALRQTQDRGAIEPLTKALYDSDREVQYQAVIGLAEITSAPSEWSPATETFEKDPKKYLDHWREWAKTNK